MLAGGISRVIVYCKITAIDFELPFFWLKDAKKFAFREYYLGKTENVMSLRQCSPSSTLNSCDR